MLSTPSGVRTSTFLPKSFSRYTIRLKKLSYVGFSNSTRKSMSLPRCCFPRAYEPKSPIRLTEYLLSASS